MNSDFEDQIIAIAQSYKNQEELANAIGVKREYMNRIIMGKFVVTVVKALRIARALNT